MTGKAVGIFLVSLCSLSTLVVAAETSTLIAEPLGGTYAGEAVVRSLGGSNLVVAVDETGEGAATRLFFVETARPVGVISLGSAVSRIEKTTDTLVITLPREHRVFVFSLAALPSQGTSKDPRLAVTAFENVRSIREYRGNLRQVLPLSAIRAKGLQAFNVGLDGEQRDPENGGNTGCARSCSLTCGDASSCNASCGSTVCGSCRCTAGASCFCR